MYKFIIVTTLILNLSLNASNKSAISRELCVETISKYPLIYLFSKSPQSWLRTLSDPKRSQSYGINLYVEEDKLNAKILKECIKTYSIRRDFKLGDKL